MKTINSEKKPIKLWLDELDNDTLSQAKNLANLPFIHSHIAIMPDAHVGYGMPIGGVAATRGAVIPNAVGVDIGCGVHAVQTSLRSLEKTKLKKLLQAIRSNVPLGFRHHKKPQSGARMPDLGGSRTGGSLEIVSREYENGRLQLGTLGGGNHFIEVQLGDDGLIWLMIHSGSRNIGYKVAGYYNKIAKSYNAKHGNKVPPKWQLDYLPVESDAGVNYLTEMNYCVAFAAANRRAMMHSVKQHLTDIEPSATFSPPIDVAHNYAAAEYHFNKEVIVHRKGATRAEKDGIGIIPGSQGSTSYIVRGLGNRESFSSCSHGAGRRLGRKQAQRGLDLKKEIQSLDKMGILHAIRHKKDLDEAPGAYKDISLVMANQRDLVEIITTLRPLGVVKG